MQQFGAQPQGGGAAQVRFGVYNQNGNFAGQTVGQVRQQFQQLWGIPADASAFNGNQKLADNDQIQPGMNIEFHRRAGEKG